MSHNHCSSSIPEGSAHVDDLHAFAPHRGLTLLQMRSRSLCKPKVAGIIQHRHSISKPPFLQPSLPVSPQKAGEDAAQGRLGLPMWALPATARAGSVAVVSLSLRGPSWPCVHSQGGGERLWCSWGQNDCKLLMEPWAAAGRSSQSRSQLSRNIGLHLFLRLVEGMRVSMATCVFCSSGLLTHF